MVCITLIFEELEYVVLNPSSFCDIFLEIMLFSSSILRGVTWCPSKLISLQDGFLLGGYMKIHHPSFHTFHFPYLLLPYPLSLIGNWDWIH
jgi:hypothetical protein